MQIPTVRVVRSNSFVRLAALTELRTVRIISSPLRRCFESQWLMPRGTFHRLIVPSHVEIVWADLMIRLGSVIIPGDKPRSVFLPVGLEHPAIRPFRGGKTHYLLCWKPVVEFVLKTCAFAFIT